MKKYIFLSIAALCALASCTEEFAPEQAGVYTQACPVTLQATVNPATKLALDGLDLTWTAGDKVYLRAADQTWAGTECDSLTSAAAGKASAFTGTVRYAYESGKDIYAFWAGAKGFSGSSASTFTSKVAATQDGTATSQTLLWTVIPNSAVTQEAGSYKFSGEFAPFVALLKFNLAESLGVTEFTVTGTGLAGTQTVNAAAAAGVGTSSFLSVSGASNTVTVSRSGSVISGDVYVAVAANAYDASTGYFNNSQSLEFVFSNSQGRTAEVSSSLSKPIVTGSVKNLGTITALTFKGPKATGTLGIVSDAGALKLTVTGAPTGSTFHYEIGDTGTAEPTTSSASFTEAEGFVIPTDEDYVAKMVRVLIHPADDNYSDGIVCGYVRNWNTTTSCGIYNAFQTYKSNHGISGSLPVSATGEYNNQITADGLTANASLNDKTANLSNGGDYIKVWCTNLIARTVNDKANIQYRRVYYGGTAGNKFCVYKGLKEDGYVGASGTWTENYLVPSPAPTESSPAVKVFSGAKYNSLAANTPICMTGNVGDYYNCAISLLEAGDNVVVGEVKEKVGVALKFHETAFAPTIVVDTATVGADNLSAGLKFYYTCGTDGFDALATPTTASSQLTEDGLTFKSVTKHDSLYVKVLATGSRFEDAYAEYYMVDWNFGHNFEPESRDTTQVNNYDFYVANVPYYGLTYNVAIGVNKTWGDRAQFQNNCQVYTTVPYAGTAQMHVGMVKADAQSGKGIDWYFNGKWIVKTVTPTVVPENRIGIAGPAKSLAAGSQIKCALNLWFQIRSITVGEQVDWTPSFSNGSGTIGDLKDGTGAGAN